ncbi:uncharacterized protein LOC122030360, partial [Zingiber officinale]|uniref:uncharacterized protein LOC122030360 n=1 Tax=Zingiber officinale TaxID=94328 RepID=UPI001C4CA075
IVHLVWGKSAYEVISSTLLAQQAFPFFSASFAPKIIVSQSVQHSRRDPSLKIKRASKREHHLWMKRDSAGSGQKALNLVHTKLPNEKEVIYGMLDKWSAFETEFPVIAAAKAIMFHVYGQIHGFIVDKLLVFKKIFIN